MTEVAVTLGTPCKECGRHLAGVTQDKRTDLAEVLTCMIGARLVSFSFVALSFTPSMYKAYRSSFNPTTMKTGALPGQYVRLAMVTLKLFHPGKSYSLY